MTTDTEPRKKRISPQKVASERTRRAAAMRLNDPICHARIDLIIEAYEQMLSRSTVVRLLMRGLPEQNIPPLSSSQAYDYLKRADMEMEAELRKGRKERAMEHRNKLRGIARAAAKAGKYSDSLAALDRLALIEGTANPITAPKTLHLPEGPAPSSDLSTLSDEELAARLAKLRAKATPQASAA